MINFKTAAFIAAICFGSISSSNAQKESVILYNSQPVKVELTEQGNIQSFVGLVAGYMDGYDMTPTSTDIKNESNIVSSPEIEQNAGYSVVSTERIELQYKPNFATLDKVVIDKLNDIAAQLKLDASSKILLTAHSLEKENKKLATNRLASAIAYLGIKGIHPDRIKSEVQKSTNLVDVIMINYLR